MYWWPLKIEKVLLTVKNIKTQYKLTYFNDFLRFSQGNFQDLNRIPETCVSMFTETLFNLTRLKAHKI